MGHSRSLLYYYYYITMIRITNQEDRNHSSRILMVTTVLSVDCPIKVTRGRISFLDAFGNGSDAEEIVVRKAPTYTASWIVISLSLRQRTFKATFWTSFCVCLLCFVFVCFFTLV